MERQQTLSLSQSELEMLKNALSVARRTFGGYIDDLNKVLAAGGTPLLNVHTAQALKSAHEDNADRCDELQEMLEVSTAVRLDLSFKPLSFLDLLHDRASHSGIKLKSGEPISGDVFDRCGIPIICGCCACHEAIGPDDAYPTKSGWCKCGDCLESTESFISPEDYNRWCELHTTTFRNDNRLE